MVPQHTMHRALGLAKAIVIAAIVFNVVPDIFRYSNGLRLKRLTHPVLLVDSVERFDRRVATLRGAIEPGEPLAYVSDLARSRQLFRSQYSLAPNLLIPLIRIPKLRLGASDSLPPPRFAVGIFEDPSNLERIQKKYSLQKPRAFAEGVYLFEVSP